MVPAVGDVVHYRTTDGDLVAAVVTGVLNELQVNLRTMPDRPGDGDWRGGVYFDATGLCFGCWTFRPGR